MAKESDFAGKWSVVEAMDMVDDYLSLMPDPHLKIEVNGKNEVAGSYQFGAQDGSIDGQFELEKDKESLPEPINCFAPRYPSLPGVEGAIWPRLTARGLPAEQLTRAYANR